jgi:hypothetical protein
MTTVWGLFVSHACEICAEAEARVQASGLRYERRLVTPSPDPGFVMVSSGASAGAGAPDTPCPKSAMPAVPALWDIERNELHVGLEAIDAVLQSIAVDGGAACGSSSR